MSTALPATAAVRRRISGEGVVWLVLAAALLLRVLLAYHDIARPGLQYDESLFVNAATDQQPGVFLFKEVGGLPLMVFPYIGALKSWLLAPVFAVFDVRPATIRMPAVLMTTVGLAVLYPAVRSLVDRRTALLVLALLLLDSSTFWLTRDDVGPSAIEFTAKCLVLWCAARLLATRRPGWAVALVAVLALATFNKLNFIWTVNGVAAVSALAMVANRGAVRRGVWRRASIAWVAGMAVLYGVFGWYYLHFDIGGLANAEYEGSLLGFTWPRFVAGTNAALSGTAFHDLALGPMAPRTGVTIVLLVLFAFGAAMSVVPGRTRCWPVVALACTTLLVAAQMLVVANATAPWHYVSPLPFGAVVAAYGVVATTRLLAGPRERLAGAAVVIAGVVALLLNAGLLLDYERDIDRGEQTTVWTPLIYDVDAFARRQPGTIVTADWGVFNQVWALSPQVRPRLREEAFTVQAGGAGGLASALASAAQPVHLVVHGKGHDVFEGNRDKLLRALRGRLELVRTIPAPDGTTMFELYRFG